MPTPPAGADFYKDITFESTDGSTITQRAYADRGAIPLDLLQAQGWLPIKDQERVPGGPVKSSTWSPRAAEVGRHHAAGDHDPRARPGRAVDLQSAAPGARGPP